jgi:hypothetical protein
MIYIYICMGFVSFGSHGAKDFPRWKNAWFKIDME